MHIYEAQIVGSPCICSFRYSDFQNDIPSNVEEIEGSMEFNPSDGEREGDEFKRALPSFSIR